MNVIGLIGITPKTTLKYYRELNEICVEEIGTNSSSKMLINAINLQDFIDFESNEETDKIIALLIKATEQLKAGGASFALLGANATHLYFNAITKATNFPFIHIADAIAQKSVAAGISKVALIGTSRTMKCGFYKGRLSDHGITSLTVKDAEDIAFLDEVIYKELLHGIHNVESRKRIIALVETLVSKGAEAVVLGCTEFTHFLREEHFSVPVFDSTLIHTRAAFEKATEI